LIYVNVWRPENGSAVLFIGALALFCISLIDVARVTRITLHDLDLRET